MDTHPKRKKTRLGWGTRIIGLFGTGRLRFVDSHPKRKKTRLGLGTRIIGLFGTGQVEVFGLPP
jgi:hypothetical protein